MDLLLLEFERDILQNPPSYLGAVIGIYHGWLQTQSLDALIMPSSRGIPSKEGALVEFC